MIPLPDTEERARQDALLEEYLAEPDPKTRDEWIAALERWEGKTNIESLLVWGDLQGWIR